MRVAVSIASRGKGCLAHSGSLWVRSEGWGTPAGFWVDTEGLTLSHSCHRSPLECWDLLPSALSRPAGAALGRRRWGQESADRPLPAPGDGSGWLHSPHLTPGSGCRERPVPSAARCTEEKEGQGPPCPHDASSSPQRASATHSALAWGSSHTGAWLPLRLLIR